MHYVIHCLDHDGAVEKRLAHYDAHKAYLAEQIALWKPIIEKAGVFAD